MDGKKIALSLFIGFIMVTSVIGIVLVNYGSDNEGPGSYNGFKFSKGQDGYLTTRIDSRDVAFVYFPAELESMDVSPDIIGLIKGTRMIYITSDFNSNFSQTIGIAEYNLGYAIQDLYSIFPVLAFTGNETNLPVITCKNATRFVPVISFQEANSTSIRLDSDCIVIESSNAEGFIKGRDRLLYGITGVMDGN